MPHEDAHADSRRSIDADLYQQLGEISGFMRTTRDQITDLFRTVNALNQNGVTRHDLADLETRNSQRHEQHVAEDRTHFKEIGDALVEATGMISHVTTLLIGTDQNDGRDGALTRLGSLEESRTLFRGGWRMIAAIGGGAAGFAAVLGGVEAAIHLWVLK